MQQNPFFFFFLKVFIKRILNSYRIDGSTREVDLGLGNHDYSFGKDTVAASTE